MAARAEAGYPIFHPDDHCRDLIGSQGETSEETGKKRKNYGGRPTRKLG